MRIEWMMMIAYNVAQGLFDRLVYRLVSERAVTSTELEVTAPTRLEGHVDSIWMYIGPGTKYVVPGFAEILLQ